MTELNKQREAFEGWIKLPPFEHTCERRGPDGAWPGAYTNIETELAWEAWIERHYQAEEQIEQLEAERRELIEQLRRATVRATDFLNGEDLENDFHEWLTTATSLLAKIDAQRGEGG